MVHIEDVGMCMRLTLALFPPLSLCKVFDPFFDTYIFYFFFQRCQQKFP